MKQLEKLRLDDFTKYKFLSGLEHNPSGTHACFVVHEANLEENDYTSNLWILEVSTGSSYQLTALGKERSFIWLSDQEILFAATRSAKDQERQKKGEQFTVYYKINIHGGEAVEAFRVPLRVRQLKPLPDQTFLLTATYNPKYKDLTGLDDEEKAKELKQREEGKDYEVLEEIPYWSNGGGFTSGNRTRLYIYDNRDQSLQALTSETMDVEGVELNQNKTKAVFPGSDYTGMMPLRNSLYLVDLESRAVSKLTPDEEFSYWSAHFISDELLMVRGSARQRYGLNENPHFYSLSTQDGTKTLLTPDFDLSMYSSVGSDSRYGGGKGVVQDGEFLYFVTTERESSYLNRINPQGQIEKVSQKPGSIDSFSVKHGQVLVVALRDLSLQEVYSLHDGEETKLTSFNRWVNEERTLSQPEALSFPIDADGTCEGWILKPVGYTPGQKYPAILNIHGGPKTVFGTVFFHEMQYWANEGYFVFFCNPRGSDGKGNEFADIRGKYGTIDYDDLMRFTDLVLEKYPEIDQARVGVTGGSYGGFMTNWIVGHTDRFRAAASQRSISNWVSMGYTTDIGYYFTPDQIAATPWTDYEKLWEHSPLKYADRVKTPTLFIHSDEDYRCWVPEALQMFTALKYHGVESRLCLFKGENHELSRGGKPKHRIRRLEEITNWFHRFLKEQ